MATHKTSVREEFRVGMRRPEFRVTCSCMTWQDKAITRSEAEGLGTHHEQYPHKTSTS